MNLCVNIEKIKRWFSRRDNNIKDEKVCKIDLGINLGNNLLGTLQGLKSKLSVNKIKISVNKIKISMDKSKTSNKVKIWVNKVKTSVSQNIS